MTPDDYKTLRGKLRRRRDSPELLDLQDPVEHVSPTECARRFPPTPQEELGAIWGAT